MKKYQTFLIALNTALTLVLILLAAALAWNYFYQEHEENPEDFMLYIDEISMRLDELSEKNRELREKADEASDKLKNLQLKEAEKDWRVQLPKEYVKQVDEFFQSPGAQDLLPDKARRGGIWKFSKARFLADDLMAIDYSLSGDTETLLISIKVLDYKNLEFNVIWDSMEIQ
jgi:hypothetical protein